MSSHLELITYATTGVLGSFLTATTSTKLLLSVFVICSNVFLNSPMLTDAIPREVDCSSDSLSSDGVNEANKFWFRDLNISGLNVIIAVGLPFNACLDVVTVIVFPSTLGSKSRIIPKAGLINSFFVVHILWATM